MNKSASRELAFKFLYSQEIVKDYGNEQFELFCETNEIDKSETYCCIEMKNSIKYK